MNILRSTAVVAFLIDAIAGVQASALAVLVSEIPVALRVANGEQIFCISPLGFISQPGAVDMGIVQGVDNLFAFSLDGSFPKDQCAPLDLSLWGATG